MIFDIVENIMEWTVPNENRMWKMYRRVFLKKKQSVSGQFTAVKYRSEKYYWTQKLNREDYGVDRQVLGTFFFHPDEI